MKGLPDRCLKKPSKDSLTMLNHDLYDEQVEYKKKLLLEAFSKIADESSYVIVNGVKVEFIEED